RSTEPTPLLTEGPSPPQATHETPPRRSSDPSAAPTFTIITAAPKVTLSQPETPSNHTKPTFTGTTSDSTQVTVHIYNALHAEVASAKATPSGKSWSSTEATPALREGTYTAQATHETSLANP